MSFCKCVFEEEERFIGWLSGGFMSASFDLVVIGAPLKLFLFTTIFYSLALCFMLLCFRQGLNLVLPSASMRLRPKR